MKGIITGSYPNFKKGDLVSIYEINDSIGKCFVMNLNTKSRGFMQKEWVYMDHVSVQD